MKRRFQNKYIVGTFFLGKKLWKQIPTIALFTVSFFAIYLVGSGVATAIDKHQISREPATNFLNYTSFVVNNSLEGEDVTFTLCRNHKENYNVTGVRTVYVIPEGKEQGEKVFVFSKQLAGIIDTGNCQSYFIRESAYHFKPGRYLMTLNVDFRVKYDIKKSVFVESGIFNIRPNTDAGSDVQVQLNNLQQQVEDLQAILNNLKASGVIPNNTPTQSFGNNQVPDQAVPMGGQPTTQSNQPSQSTQPQNPPNNQNDPVSILGIPVCVPLTGVCLR